MLYLGHDSKLNYPDAAMNTDSFHAYFKLEGLTADDINSIVLNFENGITTGITSQTTKRPISQTTSGILSTVESSVEDQAPKAYV